MEEGAEGRGGQYSNVTGLSIVLGMVTALDTLATQAHGAENPKLIGVYMQRSECC